MSEILKDYDELSGKLRSKIFVRLSFQQIFWKGLFRVQTLVTTYVTQHYFISEPGKFKMKPEMTKVTVSGLRSWPMDNLLLVITFSGVSLGVIIGILLKPMELDPVTVSYIGYPGELFMRLLKLMILPLIIASLITGK